MKKVLMIIGAIVLGLIALFVAVFLIVSLTSKKMKCKSDEGSITIMYRKKINGYTAKNISYDMDKANEYVKEYGIDDYLDAFEEYFEANTSGTCSR